MSYRCGTAWCVALLVSVGLFGLFGNAMAEDVPESAAVTESVATEPIVPSTVPADATPVASQSDGMAAENATDEKSAESTGNGANGVEVTKKPIEDQFAKLDLSGDGFIDLAEYGDAAFLTHKGEEGTRVHFGEVDVNGDGKISFDEYKDAGENGAHHEAMLFFAIFALILLVAKLCGEVVKKYGQPAVLGELLAGVLLGGSLWAFFPFLGGVGDFLRTVGGHIGNPANDSTAHLFSLLGELGVAILLFEIGLETDLKQLVQVGPAAMVVAVVGVFLPFGLGYLVAMMAGFGGLVPLVCGAALTATSIGITARVFSELGRLQDPESQIVLGAAVIDDVIGLIILAVVGGIVGGAEVSVIGVTIITVKAVGFLAGTILIGSFVVPPAMRWIMSFKPQRGTVTVISFVFGLILSVLAVFSGISMILGSFAAGLLLARTPQAHALAEDIAFLGRFFVPVFFVVVGAQVDIQAFCDLKVLELGGLMLLVAIVGKFIAGYAPFWFKGSKMVIGAGMIPRGEVGLIFCSMGIASGVFTKNVFSAMTFMVMLTTFVTPPTLKYIMQRAHTAK